MLNVLQFIGIYYETEHPALWIKDINSKSPRNNRIVPIWEWRTSGMFHEIFPYNLSSQECLKNQSLLEHISFIMEHSDGNIFVVPLPIHPGNTGTRTSKEFAGMWLSINRWSYILSRIAYEALERVLPISWLPFIASRHLRSINWLTILLGEAALRLERIPAGMSILITTRACARWVRVSSSALVSDKTLIRC